MKAWFNTNTVVRKLLGRKYKFLLEYIEEGKSAEDALRLAEEKENKLIEEAKKKRQIAYFLKKYGCLPDEVGGVDEDDYYGGLDEPEEPEELDEPDVEDDYDENEEVEDYESFYLDDEDEEDDYESFSLPDENVTEEDIANSIDRMQRPNMNTLEVIAVTILNKALYYCPIDTGYLRSSARLIRTSSGFAIRFYASYAFYVHEWDYSHTSPTQKKFLEDAAVETMNEIRVTYPNMILPSIRILLDPLTLYINVNTSQGHELFSYDWLEGDEPLKYNSSLSMFSTYYEADKEHLLELYNNFDDLSDSERRNEDVANMFTAYVYEKYENQFRKGR